MRSRDETGRGAAGSGVLVECLACGRTSRFGPADPAAADMPLVELTRRLRCSECGSRAVRAARFDTPRDLARAMRERMRPARPRRPAR